MCSPIGPAGSGATPPGTQPSTNVAGAAGAGAAPAATGGGHHPTMPPGSQAADGAALLGGGPAGDLASVLQALVQALQALVEAIQGLSIRGGGDVNPPGIRKPVPPPYDPGDTALGIRKP